MTTGVEADSEAIAASQWITSSPVMSNVLAQLPPNTAFDNQINVNLHQVINTFRTILKYVIR
jgi:hypothetical protein